MADNTELDPGTGGDVIATEDILGVKYEKVKLISGTAGSTTAIPAGGGTEAAALRVTVASDSTGVLSIDDNGGSLTVDGSVTADTELTTADLDSGAGTDTRAVVGLVIAKSGGAANISNTDPLPISDAGGNLSVDDGGGSLTVDGTVATTNAGTFATQESGAALTALQLIDDTVFTDDAAFTVATSKVNAIGLMADQTSTDSVNEGDIGIPRMTLTRQQIATVAPSADTEGLDVSRLISAASTNATSAKASAGKVYGWYIYNDGAAEFYLKLYDKATAPTVGSDTPKMTIPIPAGAAANVEFTNGITFGTGIAYALTTAAADSDTAAVAASQAIVNLLYK